MTKTYALKRLLEHGPMGMGAITECTGWRAKSVTVALGSLCEQGLVTRRRASGNSRRNEKFEYEATK